MALSGHLNETQMSAFGVRAEKVPRRGMPDASRAG